MRSHGLSIHALSLQNEPDWPPDGEPYPHESCRWSAEQFHDFVPLLHRAVSDRELGTTHILLGEQANWRLDLTAATMDDAATASMVGVLAAHGYGSDATPLDPQGKALWQTEVSDLEGTYDGSMQDALGWARVIHEYLVTAQVNAWHYWWLMPRTDQNDNDNQALTDWHGNPAKRMYALGQFSKFVRPGYHRLGTSYTGNVLVSAYKDDISGAFSIVAINESDAAIDETFTVPGCAPGHVTPWITSASQSLEELPAVVVSGDTFAYTLPSRSIVTFVGHPNAVMRPSPGSPTPVTYCNCCEVAAAVTDPYFGDVERSVHEHSRNR